MQDSQIPLLLVQSTPTRKGTALHSCFLNAFLCIFLLTLGTSSKIYGSPSSSMQSMAPSPAVYSDRFVPSRLNSNLENALDHHTSLTYRKYDEDGKKRNENNENKKLHNRLLRSELLGEVVPSDLDGQFNRQRRWSSPSRYVIVNVVFYTVLCISFLMLLVVILCRKYSSSRAANSTADSHHK